MAAGSSVERERIGRPPRSLEVVWDPSPEELEARVDWSSWYLTDGDDMGEGGEQDLIILTLRLALTELARERGWERVHIGSDQFFAWVQSEPLVRVSPDAYLLDDPPPRPRPASWQTWLPGHRPPRLAVAIVSDESWRKDYRENPPKYAQLGTRELAIFDPGAVVGRAKAADRAALQIFRREAASGFVLVFRGPGPARSEELDAWLCVRREGEAATLGVSRDAEGRDLLPTLEEAREAEREARLEADRRVAELEAELERLRRVR